MQAMADGDLRIVPAGRRGCQPRGMTLQNSMDRLAIMDGSLQDSADSQSGVLSALPFGSAASAGALKNHSVQALRGRMGHQRQWSDTNPGVQR